MYSAAEFICAELDLMICCLVVFRNMTPECFLSFEVPFPHIVMKILYEVTVELCEGGSLFGTPAFMESKFCILLFAPRG